MQHADAFRDATGSCPHLVPDGIGGGPSLEFDGVDDFLALPAGFTEFSKGISLFTVFESRSAEACSTVIELSNGREVDDISMGVYEGSSIFEVAALHLFGAISLNVAQQFTAVADPTLLVSFRRDGKVEEAMSGFLLPATTTRTQNFVGKSLYSGCTMFSGRVSEIAMYDRAVSNGEVATIENALRHRWKCCDAP
jgi:hypothetical protein